MHLSAHVDLEQLSMQKSTSASDIFVQDMQKVGILRCASDSARARRSVSSFMPVMYVLQMSTISSN